MRPETVLNLKPGDEPFDIRDKWLKEYQEYAREFTNVEDIVAVLSERVEYACHLILHRNNERNQDLLVCSSNGIQLNEKDRDTKNATANENENAKLDGDFPLGNETDADFAGDYFTIPDLVSIQLGYYNLVDCGYYTEYNYGVLVRMGFIAEMREEWLKAAECYEGVSGSQKVQDREHACRAKAKAVGASLYQEAKDLMVKGNMDDVFYPLERAVDMGNTDAMTEMGIARVYENFGCGIDIEEALRLLRTAAKLNNARAAYTLCELYDESFLIDVKEAAEMCQKAAELGCEKAEKRLSAGFDFRPEQELALERADSGDIDVLWELVKKCERENDREAASKWLNLAVEYGQTDALVKAAELYSNPTNEEYSEELAERNYRRAASAGSIKAIMALGNRELRNAGQSFWDMAMLLNHTEEKVTKPTEDVVEQHKKQFAWYELAAKGGDLSAIQAVCNSYVLGYPIERDYKKAVMWGKRGVEIGDEVSQYMLGYLYENGFGADRDIDKAIDLYERASEKGVRSAMVRLYQIYSVGFEHIATDPAKAAHYLFLSGEGRD